MKFLKYEVDAGPDDVVRVELSAAANVRILDGSNYRSYATGRGHRYVGGYFRSSPVHLRPPHQGHWYVVVDQGGRAGSVRASCSVL